MGLGHNDRTYRSITWAQVYGAVAGSVTTVPFVMEQTGLSTVTWNPIMPRACRLIGGAVTSQTGGDTVAGDWTLNFYLNESATILASATFPCSTTRTGSVLVWDEQLLCQPADRWFVIATGPEKSTVILRVTLEFEMV